MKTNYASFFVKSTFLASTLFLGLSACQKQNEEVMPQTSNVTEVVHSSARVNATTSYTISPAINNYTACGSVVVSSGNCGTYVSGYIRSKVISSNGSQFVIRIERCNNQQLFGAVGMAYVNATNFCGTQAGKTQIASNYWYADVTINATFTTGSVDFVPVVILPGQNIKWIGQPIKITATPGLSDTFPATVITSKSSTSIFATTENAFKSDLAGQCTWYTYGRIQELVASGYFSQNTGTLIKNAFWGKSNRDAKKWPSFIGGTWYNTNTAALPANMRKKGLIIVWAAGSLGHVGFVEWVSADKKSYRVSDFNQKDDKVYRTTQYNFDGGSDKFLGTYPMFYDLGAVK